ncbi:MAG: hypothetical protein KGI75_19420 [Rhizobiaceae bacterium]|nr:hypothetical protein [Rhizobiaceae bacterium]
MRLTMRFRRCLRLSTLSVARVCVDYYLALVCKCWFPRGNRQHILADSLEGEAREVASVLAAVAWEVRARGQGKGGRNTEFLLAFALAIDGLTGISAVAADTDGIDGSEDNAGAFADGASVSRMRAAGIGPRQALADNDVGAVGCQHTCATRS